MARFSPGVRIYSLKGRSASHDEIRETLVKAMNEACRTVYEAAATKVEYTGTGCTLTIPLVSGTAAVMAL